MGYSRSDPHRPCLREHSYGGSEVWFTNFPESEGGFDTRSTRTSAGPWPT